MATAKIKTGDQVRIISGKEKGKTGKVVQVFSDESRIVVEGLNVFTKHLRANRRGEKGQKVSFSAPIHASNLMLLCGKCGRTTRAAIKLLPGGDRVRLCKKCHEAL